MERPPMLLDWQNIVTMTMLLNQSNVCQNSNDTPHRNRKTIIKFTGRGILSSGGGITMSDFKLYCRAVVIKTAWCWYQHSHVDQCNSIEDLAISPRRYSYLILKKRIRNIHWRRQVL
jgi:hypothetical protein